MSRFREMHRSFIRSAIAAATLLLICVSAPAAGSSEESINWKQKVCAQIPREFEKLKTAAGRWQGSYTETIESFAPGSISVEPARRAVDKTNYFYDQSINGMKLLSVIDPGGEEQVMGGNGQYDFSLDKQTSNAAFYMTQYSPAPSTNYVESNRWILAAYEPCAALLTKVIDGTGGHLTAVIPVEVGGKPMLRLEFNRKFRDTAKVYPATAVIDPNFYFSVVEYKQNYQWGYSKGTVEYQRQIEGVAFPKRVVEEDIAAHDRVAKKYTVEFTSPQPCQAKAADFTLEAFGLQAPTAVRRGNSWPIVWINAIVLVALAFLSCWLAYRRSQKSRADRP